MPSMRAPRLEQLLGRIRRRLLLRHGVTGLAWTVAGVGIVVVATTILLAVKWTPARSLGIVVAWIAGATGLLRTLWTLRRTGSDRLGLARALEQADPSAAGDWASAAEFSAEGAAEPSDPGSRPLIEAHLQRMESRTASMIPRLTQAVPWAPLRTPLAAAGLPLVILTAGVLAGPAGWRSGIRFFWKPELEAQRFAPAPIAGDITLTYDFPAYLKRAPRTVAGSAGDIHAPRGTLVRLTARADRDVEKAEAVVCGETIPLQVEGRLLSGSFRLSGKLGEPGQWLLRYRNRADRVVAEGPPRSLTLEPDGVPRVQVTQPAAEVEREAEASVDVAWQASDDHSLSAVELVYQTAIGGQEQRIVVHTPGADARRARGEYKWDLSPLHLAPGTRVTYRIEATDNCTEPGPQRGSGAPQVVVVFSELDHHQKVLKQAQEVWQQLVDSLADRLEEKPYPAGGRLDNGSDWATVVGAADAHAQRTAEALRTLGQNLATDKHAPIELSRALVNVAGRLVPAVEGTLRAHKTAANQPGLLSAALVREVAESESAILHLEDIMDRQRLRDLADMTRELRTGRAELAELIRRFKESPDETTRRRVLDQVAALKQRLAALYERMRELARDISDEHMNEDAAELMDQGEQLLNELDEVQRRLASDDPDGALEQLEKLEKKLQDMEEEFSGKAGEMDARTKELAMELQRLASDLVDVEAAQEKLRQQTSALERAQREQAARQLDRLGQDFFERQQKRIQEAARGAEQAAPGSTSPGLPMVRERLESLRRALAQRDLVESRDQVARALESLQGADSSDDGSSWMPRRGPRPIWEAASPALQAVSDDIDQLLQQAGSRRSDPALQQQMRQLAQEQSNLERQTEQLRERLDAFGQKMPLFGPEQQQLIGDAARKMAEAGQKLGGTDPRSAGQAQSGALEKLRAMKQAMGNPSGQGGGQQGQGQPGGGGGGGAGGAGLPLPFASGQDGDGSQQGGEHVEVPGREDGGIDGLRRDVLDAMKEEAPERFRERVRDYYEELVR